MKKELNEKQKLFCIEYLKDFNGTRAYKTAYWWSDNTAKANASRLLANANIQSFLWDKVQKKLDKAEVWVDYVLDNLHQIVEIWMWRQKIELEDGKKKKVYDLKNVNSALEKLWKYHKMYTDRIEGDGDVVFKIVSYDRTEWQKK
jgi:phage terminase small subunit